MLSCKQFVERSSKIIENEALSLGQRVNNKLHMFFCMHCSNYIKQAQLVTETSKELQLDDAPDAVIKNSVSEMKNFSENN